MAGRCSASRGRCEGFWMAEAVWVTHAIGVGKDDSRVDDRRRPEHRPARADVHRFDAYQRAPPTSWPAARSPSRRSTTSSTPSSRWRSHAPCGRARSTRARGSWGPTSWRRPAGSGRSGTRPTSRCSPGDEVPDVESGPGATGRQIVGAEHLATRERVALYDMASLKKAEVDGARRPGLPAGAQHEPARQARRQALPTRSCSTRAAGVRSDITVARLGEDHFQLGLNGPRDIEWMERHLPADGSVQVRDISGARAASGSGDRARDLVQSLIRDDLSNEAFGFFNARRAYLREVPVVALQALLRRGARVGDLRLGGPGPEAVGSAVGGRAAATASSRAAAAPSTLMRWRRATGLGHGHDHRARPLRGRPRLRRQAGQGRLRRQGGAAEAQGGRTAPQAGRACCSTTRGWWSWAASRSSRPAGRSATSPAPDFGYSLGQSIAYAWLPPEHAEVGEQAGDRVLRRAPSGARSPRSRSSTRR